jgi:hypothetical protein
MERWSNGVMGKTGSNSTQYSNTPALHFPIPHRHVAID